MVIANPNDKMLCYCFLKQNSDDFGLLTIVNFRLTTKGDGPKQTRLAEVLTPKSSGDHKGSPYVFRALLSENHISKIDMKFFLGNLKLNTRINTFDGFELYVQIDKEYINIAKDFFQNKKDYRPNDKKKVERYDSIYTSLKNHMGENDIPIEIFKALKLDADVKEIHTIDPDSFDITENTRLFMAWIRTHALAAKNDSISQRVDDNIEKIHRKLYGSDMDT